MRQFALSLINKFKDHSDIRIFLHELWKISPEYELRVELLWSLLSYSDLSEGIYRDIQSSFTACEWEKWLPLIVEKFGGSDEEKTQVKELMSNYFNL